MPYTPSKPAPPEPKLLKVDEAALMLRIGRSTLYEFIYSGEIESVKVGRSRRIPVEAVEDFTRKMRASAK